MDGWKDRGGDSRTPKDPLKRCGKTFLTRQSSTATLPRWYRGNKRAACGVRSTAPSLPGQLGSV